MKRTRIFTITAACLLMALMPSCRKDLCYNHFRTAAIALEWEQEWERDYGMDHASSWDAAMHGFEYHTLRPVRPEWVTMVTYTDNANPREDYMPATGDNINVGDPENQSYLFYNSDTEYIVLSDVASLMSARATSTTRSRSTIGAMMDMYPEVRSTNPPDVLYAAYVEEAPEIGLHEARPMPVRMQPLVYTYVIRYEFEHGIEHVALARGALAGMAESVFLRNGVTSEESSIVLYDCEVKDYGVEAHVRSFGAPAFPDSYYGRSEAARAERPYTLNLEVKLTNGKIFEFNYDIADQIARQPRGGVIRVSGIRIEDEQNIGDSGSPFDVNLEDWGEHEDVVLPDDIFIRK